MPESPSPFFLVRPRVTSPLTGERLLLADVLDTLLERADAGAICLFGPRGSGKSTALRSLRHRLPTKLLIELLDDPDPRQVAELAERMIVIYTAAQPFKLPHLASYGLAPWGEDEAIEYLLGTHKDRCGSVVQRLRASANRDPLDLPLLWRICLDRMAEDESVTGVDEALRRHLDGQVPPWVRDRARSLAFQKLMFPEVSGENENTGWGDPGYMAFLRNGLLPEDQLWLVDEPRFRLLLAAEKLVDPIRGTVSLDDLISKLPEAVITLAGKTLHDRPDARASLEAALQDSEKLQPMGASLLHAAQSGWRPADFGRIHRFAGAHLRGARWGALRLPNARFDGADLSGAKLPESTLDGATLVGARLRNADLSGSSLRLLEAREADFTGADLRRVNAPGGEFLNASLAGASFEGATLNAARLRGADLTKASFCRADLKLAVFQLSGPLEEESWASAAIANRRHLAKFAVDSMSLAIRRTTFAETDFTGADLQKAVLSSADLRTANLSGALLMDANLNHCILEGVEIAGARFEGALLGYADLTDSVMPGASFRRGILRGARLAGIDWERADLRDADLGNVTFHLGSSRSGLVFGEPSEGTRKGFYTDDFDDQSYRAPEEIRVANLRGADLRGALLQNTDFYLVDLREAVYSVDQGIYLRRCGAILESRV